MLEIIALIWLTGQIGKMAERKGQKPGVWKLYTVLGWIAGEIAGIGVAIFAFNIKEYISMLPWAIMGAVGGYLIVRAILSNMPDKSQDFDFENENKIN